MTNVRTPTPLFGVPQYDVEIGLMKRAIKTVRKYVIKIALVAIIFQFDKLS